MTEYFLLSVRILEMRRLRFCTNWSLAKDWGRGAGWPSSRPDFRSPANYRISSLTPSKNRPESRLQGARFCAQLSTDFGTPHLSLAGEKMFLCGANRWNSTKWGCMEEPSGLNSAGRMAERPEEICKLAFRFGPEQADKMRARDDLEYSMGDQVCRIRAPN